MTDLNIYRGDSKTFNLTFVDGDGSPIDLTGATIYFTIKYQDDYVNSTSDTTDALIEKDITTHTNPTGGLSSVTIDSDDTYGLRPITYKFDMQLKDSLSDILTFVSGNFQIIADVTRRTD